MTQRELYCEVAHATGESMRTIDDFGFVLLTRGPVERECPAIERAVDDLDAEPTARFPRCRTPALAAA